MKVVKDVTFSMLLLYSFFLNRILKGGLNFFVSWIVIKNFTFTFGNLNSNQLELHVQRRLGGDRMKHVGAVLTF